MEAELYSAREELDDTYYEHSMNSRQEALDQEAQAYEESMNRFIEGLRDGLDLALEDMDGFIAGVTTAVTANAPLILDEYNKLEIALDGAIVAPWQAAKDAMAGYTQEDGLGLMNSWTSEGGVFDTFATDASEYLTSIWSSDNVDPNGAFTNAVKKTFEGIVATISSTVETARGYVDDLLEIQDSSNRSSSGNASGNSTPVSTTTPDARVKTVQEILNNVYGKKLVVDGLFGSKTKAALKQVQKQLAISQTGKWDATTSRTIASSIKQLSDVAYKNGEKEDGEYYKAYYNKVPAAFHAKGTLGTTRDEWAIDSEPWLGDELVLVPTAQGNLSYMRKGTSVIPASITENLVEWGQLNPNMLNTTNPTANINMISNAIMKPNYDFRFDSLVHVDNCSQETLKDLEKMIDCKINQFSKQLNYSVKKFAR